MTLTLYHTTFIPIVSVLLGDGFDLWYLLKLKEGLDSLSCYPIKACYIDLLTSNCPDFLMAYEKALNPMPSNGLVVAVLLGNSLGEFTDLYVR